MKISGTKLILNSIHVFSLFLFLFFFIRIFFCFLFLLCLCVNLKEKMTLAFLCVENCKNSNSDNHALGACMRMIKKRTRLL